jgi:hypothetical protein
MFKIFIFIRRYREELGCGKCGTGSGGNVWGCKNCKKGKGERKGPKITKEPEHELLAAPVRPTRKRSLQDF